MTTTNNKEHIMNPEQYEVVKVASRNFQVVGPDGPVVDSDGQPVRFKSAGEAKAEIAASVDDAKAVAAEDAGEAPQVPQKARKAPKAADEAPNTPAAVDGLTDEQIAAMDRAARLAAALAESKTLTAWRSNGREPCDRPATPVLDWMADPTTKPARKPSQGSQAAPVRTEAQEQQLRSIISERRAAGDSWGKVAAALTEANIPTPRGGPWWDTTASDLAKRLELS